MSAKKVRSAEECCKKFEYKVFSRPMLPPNSSSPMPVTEGIEWWLHTMEDHGWHFHSFAQTKWHDKPTQEWWIFRRLAREGARRLK